MKPLGKSLPLFGSVRALQPIYALSNTCSRFGSHITNNGKKGPRTQRDWNSIRLTVLGSGSCPSGIQLGRGQPSIAIESGEKQWIFDIGEGTIRNSMLLSSSLKKPRETKIFLSKLDVNHVGGLIPALAQLQHLCVATPGVKKMALDIYGPPGIYDLVSHSVNMLGVNLHRRVTVHEVELAGVLQAIEARQAAEVGTESRENVRLPDWTVNLLENATGNGGVSRTGDSSSSSSASVSSYNGGLEKKTIKCDEDGLWTLIQEDRVHALHCLVLPQIALNCLV
jgi:hypothetical protein